MTSQSEQKNEKMVIYKVVSEDNWCAFDNLVLALEFLKSSVEFSLEHLVVGDETPQFRIQIDEMTKEEYENLPEFDGF